MLDKIKKVISEYSDIYTQAWQSGDFKHPIATLVRNDIVQDFAKIDFLDSTVYMIKASCGVGRFSAVPWIAIFDKRITDSAKKGVYIVYLINKDTKRMYLTLNQSATGKSLSELQLSASEIRKRLNIRYCKPIHTGSDPYDAGCILSKEYTIEDLSNEQAFVSDLQLFVDYYKQYQKLTTNSKWWPSLEEYDPQISKEQWLDILQNTDVLGDNIRRMLTAMYKEGGAATCAELASKYGKSSSHYIMTAVHASERTFNHTGCPMPPEGNNAKWWPIMFVGKDADSSQQGNYVWKIRDELFSALGEYGIDKSLNQFEESKLNITWPAFYQEFADELLKYKDNRPALIDKIKEVYKNIDLSMPTLEKDNNIVDIDPFTIFGTFNKGIKDENRVKIISSIKNIFNIKADVPKDFKGIPTVNNLNATFYDFIGYRGDNDIDELWELCVSAIEYAADMSDEEKYSKFIEAYNSVAKKKGIKSKITMGLYWIRPYTFMNLDSRNIQFLANNNIVDSKYAKDALGNAVAYLNLCSDVAMSIVDNEQYSNFPELSYRAWISTTETEISEEIEEILPMEEKELIFKTSYQPPAELSSRNRIFFGAPGTGKSFKMNQQKGQLLEDGGDYERVTFHPDYTYAHFVGTYKPVPDGNAITYKYVPGPFMRVLAKALKNAMGDDHKPFVLLIEEINRANVAAVFGDVFQLLDRDDDNISEYPIETSQDVRQYLAQELELPEDACKQIRIPDNMFIWATMNSADQGVFPMDTAFKRRWDFEYIGIDEKETEIAGKTVVLGKGKNARVVEWNELRKAINEKLIKKVKVNEDKLLGPFFLDRKVVPENDYIDQATFIRVFKNKVLMYLFDDVAKQKRTTLFEGCREENRNIYSRICNEFDEKGVAIFGDEIAAGCTAYNPDASEEE